MNGILNEPKNFRGVPWGRHFGDCPVMETVSGDSKFRICKRKSDKMKIGTAELGSIEYHFYRDSFMKVQVSFKGDSNFSSLKNTLFHAYGDAEKIKREALEPGVIRYKWVGANVGVGLEYRNARDEGKLIYIYAPLYDNYSKAMEQEEERQLKEDAEIGSKDL